MTKARSTFKAITQSGCQKSSDTLLKIRMCLFNIIPSRVPCTCEVKYITLVLQLIHAIMISYLSIRKTDKQL